MTKLDGRIGVLCWESISVIQHRASQMIVFHTLVMTGSFTLAAKQLNTSTSYVSKQLGALEAELNLQLVQRTTRTLTFTDAGKRFATYCEQMFDLMHDAGANMLDARDDISGTIKLGLPQSFGTLHIIPALELLQQEYPELIFELTLFDHVTDMVKESLDIWITNQEKIHDGYVAQRLAHTGFVLVASPEYLLSHGVPEHPQDLVEHNCVIYHSKSRSYDNWTFTQGDEVVDVQVNGNFRIDLSEAVRDRVISGHGIGHLATYLLTDEFQQGKLIPLLPKWQTEQKLPVYAVYPKRKHLPAKFRVIIEFLRSHFGQPAYWDRDLKPWLKHR